MQINDKQITSYIQSHYAQFIADVKELAKIPAPSLQEDQRSRWLHTYIKTKLHAKGHVDSVGNVIFEQNNHKTDYIVLTAHMDIVFNDVDGIPIYEDNERIYGPGIGDNTVNVIALLYVYQYIVDAHISLPFNIIFACTCAEEGLGNLKGAKQICKAYPAPCFMIGLDLYHNACITKPVGSRRYKITIQAQGGHSYHDFGNTNAILQAGELLYELKDFKVGTRARSTFNVGRIQGGTTINSIAKYCTILFEIRSAHKESLHAMDERFIHLMNRYKGAMNLLWELIGDRPCAHEQDDRNIERMKQCLQDIHRAYKEPLTFTSGSTDCNAFATMGIPAISFGCCLGQGAHTRSEFIEKKSMEKGIFFLIKFLLQVDTYFSTSESAKQQTI